MTNLGSHSQTTEFFKKYYIMIMAILLVWLMLLTYANILLMAQVIAWSDRVVELARIMSECL